MKRWLLTLVLACLSLGVGAWAWQVYQARETNLIFGATGEEAKEWAEKAKHDRWVELVTIEIIDHDVVYVPVPNKDIDQQLKTDANNLLRRWLSNQEAASIVNKLTNSGYSQMSEQANTLADESSTQNITATWLAIVSFVIALAAIATGIRTAKSPPSHQGPSPNEGGDGGFGHAGR
jgi:chromosomal replication initiation ATPase DnaA